MAKPEGRGSYARERCKLTAGHVIRARSLIAKGEVPGRGLDMVDEACTGLVLRVTRRSATWLRKGKAGTLRIGDASVITLAQARDQAERARLALAGATWHDPKLELHAFESVLKRTGGDEAHALNVAWPEAVEEPNEEDRLRNGPWTWADLREKFLAWKMPKLKDTYRPQYERYLRHPELDRLGWQTVANLNLNELLRVRDEVLDTVARSAAKRVMRQFGEAMAWGWKQEARRCRLVKVDFPWWERCQVDYQPGKKDHVPTVEELARTLALAERHRSLGQTEHATSPGALGALWAVILTGQRTGALTKTEVASCVPLEDPKRPGWRVMGWTGAVMKSGLPHALPIPPTAWDAMDRYWREDAAERVGESRPVLFPSRRGAKHIAPEAINQLLARLQGLVNGKGDRAVRDNLFEQHGIRRWTPHDTRRALATWLGERRMGGIASAILDHTNNKAQDEREKRAPVTRLHYDMAQRIDFKAEGMEAWCEAILAAYERERDALNALPLPKARPRPLRRQSVKRSSLAA
ncbi:integrase family protein [Methylobacterium sp. BTF04]|uniref:integrase family protein n=1 Tax=Methylobacterium sp. BTF04 TaxID=2708300 RepID=UPI0013D2C887|nr:integrase family protein [Methylobacterium sp. BTF04]NEU11115.1 integrase family protein [Methylobacterium sp. BTF04]